MTTKIAAAIAEMQNLNKKLEALLKDSFAEFFKEYPEIKYIAWYQYTPYFNDGEPCEFSMTTPQYITEEEMEEQGWEELSDIEPHELYNEKYDGPELEAYERAGENRYYAEKIGEYEHKLKTWAPEEARLLKGWTEFRNAVQSVPESVFLAAFDNHIKVVAHKDGFEVFEYDHD